MFSLDWLLPSLWFNPWFRRLEQRVCLKRWMQRFWFWEFLATGCWLWSVTSNCIDFLQVIFIELQILTKTHIRCNCLMLTYQRLISWTKTEKVEMSRIGAAAVSPCSAPSYLEIDSNYYVIIKFYIISYKLSLYIYCKICPALVQQQCHPPQLLHFCK